MLCHWHFGSRWHSIYSSCCFTVFFLRWSFGSGLLFHAVKIAYSLPCFSVCISTGTFRAWSRRFPCVLFHVDLTTDQHNTFYRGS